LAKNRRKKLQRTARAKIEARPSGAASIESRSAEATTVAWMLSTTICLMSEIGAIVCRHVLLRFWPESDALQAVFELLNFSSLVIGLVSLALLPIVLKVRQVVPPLPVTLIAVAISAAPLVVRLWRFAG
jgi:hypothetical protein